MLIVDVETSGVDSRYHSLISIGAYDFNNPNDSFFEECRIFDGARIEKDALVVNGMNEADLHDQNKKTEGEIVTMFIEWLKNKSDHTVAGQNPSFDVSFLMAAAERNGLNLSIPKRVVDLHSIVYFHMSRRGIVVPHLHNRTDLDSDKIMTYVGIPAEPKPHIAINGARWEAEAFSRLFNEKSLFPEFKEYKIPWL